MSATPLIKCLSIERSRPGQLALKAAILPLSFALACAGCPLPLQKAAAVVTTVLVDIEIDGRRPDKPLVRIRPADRFSLSFHTRHLRRIDAPTATYDELKAVYAPFNKARKELFAQIESTPIFKQFKYVPFEAILRRLDETADSCIENGTSSKLYLRFLAEDFFQLSYGKFLRWYPHLFREVSENEFLLKLVAFRNEWRALTLKAAINQGPRECEQDTEFRYVRKRIEDFAVGLVPPKSEATGRRPHSGTEYSVSEFVPVVDLNNPRHQGFDEDDDGSLEIEHIGAELAGDSVIGESIEDTLTRLAGGDAEFESALRGLYLTGEFENFADWARHQNPNVTAQKLKNIARDMGRQIRRASKESGVERDFGYRSRQKTLSKPLEKSALNREREAVGMLRTVSLHAASTTVHWTRIAGTKVYAHDHVVIPAPLKVVDFHVPQIEAQFPKGSLITPVEGSSIFPFHRKQDTIGGGKKKLDPEIVKMVHQRVTPRVPSRDDRHARKELARRMKETSRLRGSIKPKKRKPTSVERLVAKLSEVAALRVSEVLALRPRDIDAVSKTVRCENRVRSIGRLTSRLLTYASERRPDEFIFPQPDPSPQSHITAVIEDRSSPRSWAALPDYGKTPGPVSDFTEAMPRLNSFAVRYPTWPLEGPSPLDCANPRLKALRRDKRLESAQKDRIYSDDHFGHCTDFPASQAAAKQPETFAGGTRREVGKWYFFRAFSGRRRSSWQPSNASLYVGQANEHRALKFDHWAQPQYHLPRETSQERKYEWLPSPYPKSYADHGLRLSAQIQDGEKMYALAWPFGYQLEIASLPVFLLTVATTLGQILLGTLPSNAESFIAQLAPGEYNFATVLNDAVNVVRYTKVA